MICQALQNADFLLRVDQGRGQKKRSNPPGAASASSRAGTGISSSTHLSPTPASQNNYLPNDADEQAAQQRNNRLFEISRTLDDSSYKAFVCALCRLNGEMIGLPPSEMPEPADGDTSVMSPTVEDGMSFKQPKRTGIAVIRTLVSCETIERSSQADD